MADFRTATAWTLMRRTAPFLVFRLVVYGGIVLATILATGTGAGLGYGIGAAWGPDGRIAGGGYGALAGFGVSAAALYLLREYLLYLVKAGHIAVMVELLQGREIPEGQGQIGHARRMVADRFGAASVLFGVDQLVKGAIQAVTGLVEGLLSVLPIPGTGALMGAVRGFLKVSVGTLDEVMLAHGMATRAPNPYLAAREALVLYAQNARAMMTNAAWVTAWVWGLSLIVFLIALVPAGVVALLLPGQMAAAGIVIALLIAWAVKAALIEPFALACMLQAWFAVTTGQAPDPGWTARLDRASDRFTALGARATAWTRPQPTAGVPA